MDKYHKPFVLKRSDDEDLNITTITIDSPRATLALAVKETWGEHFLDQKEVHSTLDTLATRLGAAHPWHHDVLEFVALANDSWSVDSPPFELFLSHVRFGAPVILVEQFFDKHIKVTCGSFAHLMASWPHGSSILDRYQCFGDKLAKIMSGLDGPDSQP